METLENTTAYKCSYCNKVSLSAAGMRMHEKWCRKNPANHMLCATCKHCSKTTRRELVPKTDMFGDKIIYNSLVTEFICDKDGCSMHSHKIRNGMGKREWREGILKRTARCMRSEAEGCEWFESCSDYGTEHIIRPDSLDDERFDVFDDMFDKL